MTPRERQMVINIRRQAKSALVLADMLLAADDKRAVKSLKIALTEAGKQSAILTQGD